MDAGKNVEGVIAALARVAAEVQFVALMCGDGPSRPHLERMTRELGIADRVVFRGYVDNLWDLMSGADAFVSLSRFEGCPNVVLEAMACGCPWSSPTSRLTGRCWTSAARALLTRTTRRRRLRSSKRH